MRGSTSLLAGLAALSFVAAAGAQTAGPMLGRAWRDSLGTVVGTFAGDAAFGFFLDPASGAVGAVRRNATRDSAQFIALGSGPAMLVTPWTARWAADSSLTWNGPDGTRRLRPVRIRGEEVSVARDSVRLAGFLAIPDGPGPHPAVLLLNGSGPSPRGLLSTYAAWFAANGIAAIVHDKRGTGRSTGTYTGDRLEELAGDANAMLELLRARPEIDRNRIGILGQSQGPWVAFLLAAKDPGIRFIISTSAGAFPADQELYRRTRLVADSGYASAEVEAARDYVQRLFRSYASTGRDTVGLSALWREVRERPWHRLVGGPSTDPSIAAGWTPVVRSFAADLARDWAAIYRSVRVPVLALNSPDDPIVPAQRSHETLRRYLGAPDRLRVELVSGNHGLTVTGADGFPRSDPRVFRIILEWAREVTRD